MIETIAGEFEDLTQLDLQEEITDATEQVWIATNEQLSRMYAVIPLLEGWIKAVDSAVHQKMHAGETIPGFKMVQGKKGNRTWTDAEEAEKLLKSMRLKTEQMYDLKLISPTKAAALQKKKLSARANGQKLKPLLLRRTVNLPSHLKSDKRAALDMKPQFEDLTVSE